MSKSALRLVSPATENRTVERSMPSRRPNADIRPREHLTEREVEKLIAAARGNRWGQRDATMILIAFRHGLRASELCELQWSDVEFETRQPASAPSQGRDNRHAPSARRRTAGVAGFEARGQVALCLRDRAWRPVLGFRPGQ